MYKTIFAIVLSLVVQGCAGISFLEMQDAETLGEGNSSLAFGSAAGLNIKGVYVDSLMPTRAVEAISWAPLEFHYQTGISDNIDLGFSLWNASLLSVFLLENRTSYNDIGLSANMKYRLFKPDPKRDIALNVSLIGMFVEHTKRDDYWRNRTGGITTGIFYSHNVKVPDSEIDSSKKKLLTNFIRSLYGGFKTYFLFSDVRTYTVSIPTEKKYENFSLLFDPFVGVSMGDGNIYFLELHCVFFKHPYSHAVTVLPALGFGGKFIF